MSSSSLFVKEGSLFTTLRTQRPLKTAWKRSRSAFTLVELLTVIAIMGVIAAVSIPAFAPTSAAQKLSIGGRLISDLATAARSEAISQNGLVRLVIATDWEGQTDVNYSRVALFAWDSENNIWGKQLSKWQDLPTGIVFQPDASLTATNSPTSVFSLFADDILHAPAPITVKNKPVKTVYIQFDPTGAMNFYNDSFSKSAVSMRLVEGSVSGSVTKVRNQNNWIEINSYASTGRIKVNRP